LIQLRNIDLDKQLEELEGSLDTTREQRKSVESELNDIRTPQDEKSRLRNQRAELDEKIKSDEIQLEYTKKKQDMLIVRSPIDGTVITWDVDRLLRGRPVNRGQILLTVANPDGEWELKLSMPEKRMGHIDEARSKLGEGEQLELKYIIETDPTSTHQGKVREIGDIAVTDEAQGHNVPIFVTIDKAGLTDPRTGATVTAKIHCGYRPLGYVLLHDLFEWVDSRVLFNL